MVKNSMNTTPITPSISPGPGGGDPACTPPSLKVKRGVLSRMKQTLQSLQFTSPTDSRHAPATDDSPSSEDEARSPRLLQRPPHHSSKRSTPINKSASHKSHKPPSNVTGRRKNGTNTPSRTIRTSAELLSTVFYQVNLLRQRWTPLTKTNFLEQLLECHTNLDQSLRVNTSLLQEMRCRWRTQFATELERVQQCWSNYSVWLREFQEEVRCGKEHPDSDCISRGRWLAEHLEDACKEYFRTEGATGAGGDGSSLVGSCPHQQLSFVPPMGSGERRLSTTPERSPPFDTPDSDLGGSLPRSVAAGRASSVSSHSLSLGGSSAKLHPPLSHEDHALLEGLKRLEEDTLLTPPPKPPVSLNGSPQSWDLCQQLEKYRIVCEGGPPTHPPPPVPVGASMLVTENHTTYEDEDNRLRAYSTPIEMGGRHGHEFVDRALHFLGTAQQIPVPPIRTVSHLGVMEAPSDLGHFFKDEDIQEEVAAALNSRSSEATVMAPFHSSTVVSSHPGLPPEVAAMMEEGKCYTTTEVKSDTEDCEEIIELNGKKYRQKYERRVVLTRHRIRQVIEAPAGVRLDLHLTDDDNVVIVPSYKNKDEEEDEDDDEEEDERTDSGSTSILSPPVVLRSELQQEPSELENDAATSCPEKPFFPLDAMEYTGSLCSSPLWLRLTMAGLPTTSCEENSVQAADPSSALVLRTPPSASGSHRLNTAELQQQFNTVSKRLSTQLFDLFRTQWHKTENILSPNERSKTISYIQRYTQQAPSGHTMHRTMCVQQTRTVRMRMKGEGDSGVLTPALENGDSMSSELLSLPSSKSKSHGESSVSSSNELLPSVQHRAHPSRGEVHPDRGSAATTVTSTTTSSSVPSIFLAGDTSPVSASMEGIHHHHGKELSDVECDDRRSSTGARLAPLPTSDGIPTSSSEDSIMESVRLTPGERRGNMIRDFMYIRSRGVWSFVLEQLDATPFIFMQKSATDSASSRHVPASINATPPKVSSGEPALTLSIKAAPVDALLVYGTTVGKQPDDFFLFFETFMTTFKMFVPVEDAIDKLVGRYLFFRLGEWSLGERPPLGQLEHVDELEREKLCATVVSFLIHLVSQIRRDLTPQIEHRLQHFRQCLLQEGQHKLAAVLQRMLQDQVEERVRYQAHLTSFLTPGSKSTSSFNQIQSLTSTSSSMNSLGSSFSSSSKPLAQQAVTVKRRSLLDFSPRSLAEQLTMIGAEKFDWIDMEDVFHSSMGVMVRPLCEHHNTIVGWTRTLLYSADREPGERKKYFHHLFEMARELYELHNFNAYIAMILGLNDAPDHMKPKKLRQKVQERVSELLPMSSRSPVYAEQMSVSPPAILYMGLISNLLAYLETNPAKEAPHPNCPELGPTVSFWRYWRHFVIINFFYRKRMEVKNSHYPFPVNEDIRALFNNFSEVLDDSTLSALKSQLVNCRDSS